MFFGWLGYFVWWNKLDSLAQDLNPQTTAQGDLKDYFSESFNQNLPSQTVTACKSDSQNCVFLVSVADGNLYFGDNEKKTYNQDQKSVEGRYDFVGDRGINIPSGIGASLKLNHKLEVEKGLDFDRALVIITDQADSKNTKTIDLKTTFARNSSDKYSFEGFNLIDISQFDGKKVDLSFVFETVDGSNNDFFGWEIYDFQILGKDGFKSTATTKSESATNISSEASQSSSSNSSQQVLPQNSQIWSANDTNPQQWQKQQHENFPFISNLWQVQSNQNETWLRYSNNQNYDNGGRNGGYLISPKILLPANKKITLQANSDLKVEISANWDRAKIFVLQDAFGTKVEVWNAKNSQIGDINIDLTKYAGQSVQLVFGFDTIDSFENSTEGWQLKNLKVTTQDNSSK